jgi:beta-carotene hydroxylase
MEMAMKMPSRLDAATLGLFAIYLSLHVANLTLTFAGLLPLPVAFLVGLAAFNLSFTIWHECVHNTVASSRWICSVIGSLTAFIMIYPGYFFQRREHLLHHKYEGDPEKDPVFYRVQCTPWMFPIHLLLATLRSPQPVNPERQFRPGELWSDRAGYVFCLAIVVAVLAKGMWAPLLAAWIMPRVMMIPIHAFYVCYLPHHGRGAYMYQTYRIVLRNPVTNYLTLFHAYHGLHHIWPGIPWHRYRQTFYARRKELEARGVEIIGGVR